MHIIFISLEIQRVRVTAYHSLAAGWLCEPVVEGEDSLCLVPYLRCLVRRYDRGRLDVVQSTGGKEQHSAAVQLGKGVRDTIQVFQGPLPVLKHIYIYMLLKSTPLTSFPSSVCHASSTALPPSMAARGTTFTPICFGKMECDPGSIRN